ncbi:MAG TPA: cobyric acid synthase [Hyphomicrobium sp.]|nr:cobyric acid synthase [Hyphomicrobium sp.]
MAARAIMFQGTGSDVGKSLLVAGLARAFRNRGLRVLPFKPQNMSNNAAVTHDGGEIGRAQALQARAAGVPPSVHMNPVLLKPQSNVGAQVVVQGRVLGNAKAAAYQTLKADLMAAVMDSFGRLSAEADIVLVEGAGSASEVNLRANDIANMGFACRAVVPVVLIGDIDRGGVIASLVGTKAVLSAQDVRMIEGFIVNKFRGDPALFQDGMAHIAELTEWRSLGLVPYFQNAHRLPEEDALGIQRHASNRSAGKTRVVVLAYPRISNFDDFDPLRLEPSVDLTFIKPGTPIPGDAALVILPGSKATIADLQALRDTGWDVDLRAHLRRGGQVLGICGGYQMLGRTISDPAGMEGDVGCTQGLGLLNIETVLTGEKTLLEVAGVCARSGASFRGYEMHVGRTAGADCDRALLTFADGRGDGAMSADGLVSGCYVHGLFVDDGQRAAWMQRIGAGAAALRYEQDYEATLDELADHLERYVDCDAILEIARAPKLDG